MGCGHNTPPTGLGGCHNIRNNKSRAFRGVRIVVRSPNRDLRISLNLLGAKRLVKLVVRDSDSVLTKQNDCGNSVYAKIETSTTGGIGGIERRNKEPRKVKKTEAKRKDNCNRDGETSPKRNRNIQCYATEDRNRLRKLEAAKSRDLVESNEFFQGGIGAKEIGAWAQKGRKIILMALLMMKMLFSLNGLKVITEKMSKMTGHSIQELPSKYDAKNREIIKSDPTIRLYKRRKKDPKDTQITKTQNIIPNYFFN